MEEFGKRLMHFIDNHLNMTIREFEIHCDFTNGLIHRALKGTNLGSDKLLIIAKKFPELNIDWLLTGEGAMIDGNHTLIGNKKLDVNANINYKESSDLINKLSSAIMSLTENDKLHAKSILQFAENDNIRAKNDQASLEIHKKLVDLLEKK